MIKSFNNISPKIGSSVYISETASVIGDVELGNEVNIWFGAVIRGDMHYIKIGSRTNIQDNSVVHITTAVSPTNIGSGVTIGHGAIIHAANSFKVRKIDILEKSKISFYSRFTSHLSDYHTVYRSNFNSVKSEIYKKVFSF